MRHGADAVLVRSVLVDWHAAVGSVKLEREKMNREHEFMAIHAQRVAEKEALERQLADTMAKRELDRSAAIAKRDDLVARMSLGVAEAKDQLRLHIMRGVMSRLRKVRLRRAFLRLRADVHVRRKTEKAVKRLALRAQNAAFQGWRDRVYRVVTQRQRSVKICGVLGRGVDTVLLRTMLLDWSSAVWDAKVARAEADKMSEYEREKRKLTDELEARLAAEVASKELAMAERAKAEVERVQDKMRQNTLKTALVRLTSKKKRTAFVRLRDEARMTKRGRSLVAKMLRQRSAAALRGWRSTARRNSELKGRAKRAIMMIGRGVDTVLLRSVLTDWYAHVRQEKQARAEEAKMTGFEAERQRLHAQLQRAEAELVGLGASQDEQRTVELALRQQALADAEDRVRRHILKGQLVRWRQRRLAQSLGVLRESATQSRRLRRILSRMQHKQQASSFAGWRAASVRASALRRRAEKICGVIGRGVNTVLVRSVLLDWHAAVRQAKEEKKDAEKVSEFEKERRRLLREKEDMKRAMQRQLDDVVLQRETERLGIAERAGEMDSAARLLQNRAAAHALKRLRLKGLRGTFLAWAMETKNSRLSAARASSAPLSNVSNVFGNGVSPAGHNLAVRAVQKAILERNVAISLGETLRTSGGKGSPTATINGPTRRGAPITLEGLIQATCASVRWSKTLGLAHKSGPKSPTKNLPLARTATGELEALLAAS